MSAVQQKGRRAQKQREQDRQPEPSPHPPHPSLEAPRTPLPLNAGADPFDAAAAADDIHEIDDAPDAPPAPAKAHAARTAWWARARPAGVSLTLENAGSVARDHLASERTFLAYVRTSLALASMGVALVQLFALAVAQAGVPATSAVQRFARPLGAATVGMGLFVLAVGFTRYFRIQKALVAGFFPPASVTIAFTATVLALLIAVVFGILVGVAR